MSEVTSPAVERRRLAKELRRLRTGADKTIHEVAEILECSPGKISRIETGIVGAQPRDVRDMLDIYGIGGEQREQLLDLVRHSRRRAWWHEFAGVVPAASARFYGLEDGASAIDNYSSTVLLPGLLQTDDYARALMARAPDLGPNGAPDLVERRVELRRRRRELLRRVGAPQLAFVVSEAALLARVGGTAVLAEQLGHLAELAMLPTMSLRVLPLEAGEHVAFGTVFTVFTFEDEADQQIVYLEQLTGNTYLERPDDITIYNAAFAEATGLALSREESHRLIVERAAALS